MGSPRIDINLQAYSFHPGDTVAGRLVIGFDKKARSARVELRCVNRFNAENPPNTPIGMLTAGTTGDASGCDATTDAVIVAEIQLPSAQGEQQFELTVPDDAPPSAYDETLPPELRRLVSWEVRVSYLRSRLIDVPHEVTKRIDVYPRSSQYGEWVARPELAESSDCPIELQLVERTVSPGESLLGTLALTPRKPVRAKAVQVHLTRRRYDFPQSREAGGRIEPGTNSRPWIKPIELSGPAEFAADQTYTLPFALQLPARMPPSFAALHNELHWFVVGTLERGLRSNYTGELEVIVHTTPASHRIMEFADFLPVWGKGTVVKGLLEHEVHVGDSVRIVGLGTTVIDGITVSKKLVPGAAVGEEAGLLLKHIAADELERGGQVVSV